MSPDFESKLQSLSKRLNSNRDPSIRRRYISPEIRDEAIEIAAELVAQGLQVKDIAIELGIASTTLSRWLRHFRKPKLARVTVQPPNVHSEFGKQLVLSNPNGWRLEGLDVQTAVQVLRGLE